MITSHRPSFEKLFGNKAATGTWENTRIRKMAELPPVEGELDEKAVWSQELKLGTLVEQLPASKHRRALEYDGAPYRRDIFPSAPCYAST